MFDLSDDEIEELQNIIGTIDNDEERDFYFTTDDPMPEPLTSKINEELFNRYVPISTGIIGEAGEKLAEIEGTENGVHVGMEPIAEEPESGSANNHVHFSAEEGENECLSLATVERAYSGASNGENSKSNENITEVKENKDQRIASGIEKDQNMNVELVQIPKREVPNLIPVSKVGKNLYGGMDSSTEMLAPHISQKYHCVRDPVS